MRGSLQEVVVDRLELVRQRVDAGDGEREVGVVLVGQAEPLGLDAEAEAARVAVEGLLVGGDGQVGELLGRQDRVVRQAGLQSPPDDLDGIAQRDDGEHLHRLGQGGAANDTPRTKRSRRRHRDRPAWLLVRSLQASTAPPVKSEMKRFTATEA